MEDRVEEIRNLLQPGEEWLVRGEGFRTRGFQAWQLGTVCEPPVAVASSPSRFAICDSHRTRLPVGSKALVPPYKLPLSLSSAMFESYAEVFVKEEVFPPDVEVQRPPLSSSSQTV